MMSISIVFPATSAVLMCLSVSTASVPITYVETKTPSRLVSPVEVAGMSKAVLGICGNRDGTITNCTLIAWCLKKWDVNLPPFFKEEGLLLFQETGPETNRWILACVERVLRGGSGRSADWGAAPSVGEMGWCEVSPVRPSNATLQRFIRRTNFGHNECRAEWEAIYVSVYSPFRGCIGVLEKGVPPQERERRSRALHERDDIVDPVSGFPPTRK
jgi:hypothetical protein